MEAERGETPVSFSFSRNFLGYAALRDQSSPLDPAAELLAAMSRLRMPSPASPTSPSFSPTPLLRYLSTTSLRHQPASSSYQTSFGLIASSHKKSLSLHCMLDRKIMSYAYRRLVLSRFA